jgi:hypothetical protein
VTRQPQSIECVYEVEVRVAVLVTGLGMQGRTTLIGREMLWRSPERGHRVPGTSWHGAGRVGAGQCRGSASCGLVLASSLCVEEAL